MALTDFARTSQVVRAGMALAVVMSLTGCFGRAGDGESLLSLGAQKEDIPAEPALMTRLWAKGGTPFSHPINVGGVAVLLVKKGRYLRINAMDPATGKVLWSDTASPSFIGRGTALLPYSIGDKIAYFRAADSADELKASLVIADPRTGKRLVTTPKYYFGTNIHRCPHDPAVACVGAWNEKTQEFQNFQISVDRPKLVAQKYPVDTWYVASGGLMVTGYGAKGQKLGVFQNGTKVWQRPLSELLGPGVSTSNGAQFARWEKEGIYTGSAGSNSWSKGSKVDLGKASTSGFRASDGQPLWTDRGSNHDCFGSAYLADPNVEDQAIPLRCRYRGTFTEKSGTWIPSKSASVRLERFDVTTGKSVWSTPIGRAPIFTFEKAGIAAVADDNHILVNTGKTKILVDLTTGQAVKAGAATQTWCRPNSTMDYHLGVWRTDNTKNYYLRSWGLTYPCSITGKPLAEPSVTSVPSFVSARFDGGISVYASPKGIVAYQPTSPAT